MELYFRRDLYDEMLSWKDYRLQHPDSKTNKVLEIVGPRRVGKTSLVKRFAEENFKAVVYISLEHTPCISYMERWAQSEDGNSGFRLLCDLAQIFSGKPVNAEDSFETVFIVDEVQESPDLHNLYEYFGMYLKANIIFIGSYIARVLVRDESDIGKGFKMPGNEIFKLTLYSLSFIEFLKAVGVYAEYESVKMDIPDELHKTLDYWYSVYRYIGGYPQVVAYFLNNQQQMRGNHVDFWRAIDGEIKHIIDTFSGESRRYLYSVYDEDVFNKMLLAVSMTLIKGDVRKTDTLNKELFTQVAVAGNTATKNRVVAWIHASHMIELANRINLDERYNNTTPDCCAFYTDMGMARYFLQQCNVSEDTLLGMLAENFVFIEMLHKSPNDMPSTTTFRTPTHGIYKNGQIDFYTELVDGSRHGIEVKVGSSQGKTAQALLRDKRVDHILYIKGEARYGTHNNTTTIPPYLFPKYRFRLSRKPSVPGIPDAPLWEQPNQQ